MSRNRVTMSDSSEEDDEVALEEESDSELELQQTQSVMRKPLLPPPSPSSSEEEDPSEEFETESNSDSDLMQKTLAAKPLVETQPKPVEDSNLRFTLVKISPGTNKATNSSDAADVVTRAKKSETSERKSNLFQRIWSEGDEIVILKGMIDYLATYKTDPTQDIDEFHSVIKEDLQADGSRAQLLDKIRRMRKKFERKIKSGRERTFSKPHEQSVYDLSKMIWGNKEKAIVVRGSSSKKESEEVLEKKRKRVDLNNRGAMTVEERMLMDGGDLFEPGQGRKGEKEWKKLRVEEWQNYLKHLEVRVVQTKLILGAMMKRS
ncbi:probable transcription factor At1g61730 [Salvia hispanica]|uniref:probable transcription factor At1g61730 n=1 Tax=Salvia hispanica TaxID=49212 RepID=UPI00200900EB|nr:probable transcription factor At1g61730 [Salvia hispanica]